MADPSLAEPPVAAPMTPVRTFSVQESPETPLLGLVFGWAPMVPFGVGAVAAWTLGDPALTVRLTIIWGGAILAFLAGVRRGLSFRSPGGPDVRQIAAMLWLYLLALASLAAPFPLLAIALLVVGYGCIAVLDPPAAERGEVPLFFARFRPVQMMVPLICLGAVAVRILAGL